MQPEDDSPPRLLAQMHDPNVRLPDALELAMFKAQQFQAHFLATQGFEPPELTHILARVREAHFWLSELTVMIRLAQKPNLVVAQDIPPLIQQ